MRGEVERILNLYKFFAKSVKDIEVDEKKGEVEEKGGGFIGH